jgi:hypothetical protein
MRKFGTGAREPAGHRRRPTYFLFPSHDGGEKTRLGGELRRKEHLKLKLFTTCAGKLDRLLSLGPLYFAFQDLLASWARVSSTKYTYRHT